MKEEIKEEIKEVTQEMDDVANDRDVPRNVREKLGKAQKMINKKAEKDIDAQNLDFTRAIYLMNEASEDINIPFHTRTDIMNITSKLEKIKESIK